MMAVDEVKLDPALVIAWLARRMRANSERWFPQMHDGTMEVSLATFYTLGLCGEVGEVADEIKKGLRRANGGERRVELATELADVFTYLLLLVDELDIDLVGAYEAKVSINNARWGGPE